MKMNNFMFPVSCFMLYVSFFMFLFPSSASHAQDEDQKKNVKEIIEEIGKVKEAMTRSEEYLLDSIRSLDKRMREKIHEKYEKLKKDMPGKLPEKLVEKSHDEQKSIVDKLKDLIKKIEEMPHRAPSSSGDGGGSGGSGGNGQQQGQEQGKENQSEKPGGGPAEKPYSPNENDPLNKFKDIKGKTFRWGMLPPKEREKIFRELEQINSYPARYREYIRAYLKKLAEIKE